MMLRSRTAAHGRSTAVRRRIRLADRIHRVPVPQPVERRGQAIAPPAQRRALGEELVWASEPRILEDRKQQVIGIGWGDAAKIGLLRECPFERVDDRGEFADPARPVGTIFFGRAAERSLARATEIVMILWRQTK